MNVYYFLYLTTLIELRETISETDFTNLWH